MGIGTRSGDARASLGREKGVPPRANLWFFPEGTPPEAPSAPSRSRSPWSKTFLGCWFPVPPPSSPFPTGAPFPDDTWSHAGEMCRAHFRPVPGEGAQKDAGLPGPCVGGRRLRGGHWAVLMGGVHVQLLGPVGQNCPPRAGVMRTSCMSCCMTGGPDKECRVEMPLETNGENLGGPAEG